MSRRTIMPPPKGVAKLWIVRDTDGFDVVEECAVIAAGILDDGSSEYLVQSLDGGIGPRWLAIDGIDPAYPRSTFAVYFDRETARQSAVTRVGAK